MPETGFDLFCSLKYEYSYKKYTHNKNIFIDSLCFLINKISF